jgi:hypothetical protein
VDTTSRQSGTKGFPGRSTRVIEVCGAERRCLVTLDLDFSNPFVFPPEQYAGIAVLRLPRRLSPDDLYAAVGTLITALRQRPIEGKLWIVERHRIREYLPDEDSTPSES